MRAFRLKDLGPEEERSLRVKPLLATNSCSSCKRVLTQARGDSIQPLINWASLGNRYVHSLQIPIIISRRRSYSDALRSLPPRPKPHIELRSPATVAGDLAALPP